MTKTRRGLRRRRKRVEEERHQGMTNFIPSLMPVGSEMMFHRLPYLVASLSTSTTSYMHDITSSISPVDHVYISSLLTALLNSSCQLYPLFHSFATPKPLQEELATLSMHAAILRLNSTSCSRESCLCPLVDSLHACGIVYRSFQSLSLSFLTFVSPLAQRGNYKM